MSSNAYATDPAPVEQVVVSPASQAVIDTLANANTQVMEAAGASSALDQAVTTANTQITEANATSAVVSAAVTNAQTAVAAIEPAVQAVVDADPVTTYQNSTVVENAQDRIAQAQTAVSAIQTAVTTAQTEITQATTARSAIAPIITDANTQVYQANQAIATAQAAINALEGTISTSRSVLANTDDAGVLMILPFDLLMGGTLYHNIYVGSNATITFGVNQGSNYSSTPSAPSVSVGGYDWTTWSQGSGIIYSTTATSLDISWDVRPFPQMDFSTVVNQLRFNADVNPTTGAWIADVTGTGPNVGNARWNYRQTNNGAVTQIIDTDLSQGVAGHIGQGNYTPIPVDPNAPNVSAIQTQIADANQTLFGLQYMVTSVASNIGTDTARYNALPQITATTTIANANAVVTLLNQTITTKASDLQTVVDQLAQAPTPPPVPPVTPNPEPVVTPQPDPITQPVLEPVTPVVPEVPPVEQPTDVTPDDSSITDPGTEEQQQTTDQSQEGTSNTGNDETDVVDSGTDTSTDQEQQTPDQGQENQSEEPQTPPVDETPTVSDVLDEAMADGVLTDAEKEAVVEALLATADGEAVTAEDMEAAGLTYEDLPAETPVDVRQDENGNQVIITAEVAAALQVLESPSELIGAIFDDPGQVLLALASIGADMSPQEREEAQKMVVATVIAGGAAMNAASVAAASTSSGRSTGGGTAPKSGGTGGGPASGNDKPKRTFRRRTK
jgi:hypothetical protein